MYQSEKDGRRKLRLRLITIFFSAALGSCSSTGPLLCSFPFSKTAAFIVTVPETQTVAYDVQITAFMKHHALRVAKGSYSTSAPPEMQRRYTLYQVEGCDGWSYVWSDNSTKPHEYLVTFHHSPLFKDRTATLRNDFLSEFRRHYRIRPYVDWRS